MPPTLEDIKKIGKNKLPKHIGIILDGNRRWAKKRNLDVNFGHLVGYENLKKRLFDFFDAGVHYLSIYALSLENVKRRKPEEIEYIYKIMIKAVDTVIEESIVKKDKVKFSIIGKVSMLPQETKQKLEELIEFTQKHDKNFINLCIMYDGQEEIVDAVKEIIHKKIPAEDVNTDLIKKHLYTKDFPPVDYLIRTGMDDGARISGFLLWDLSYAEFKFRNDFWPDYNKDMVFEDLEEFVNRNRRLGI